MNAAESLTRRAFLERTAAGIVVLVAADPMPAQVPEPTRLYPEDFNAYLAIRTDGRVTVFSGKVEMGQGVLTSQAQMVAEELGVDLASIDMVLGDTDRCPWDMGTFGSLTTRMFGPALRAAAAQARLTLMSLASERLGVPLQQLRTGHGVVMVEDDPARRLSYGELSGGARIARVVDRKAVLRAASQFSAMGLSPKRLDGREKVTGAAQYAADIRLPGMLYARLLRPPAHGATLVALDTREAEAQSGVTVVRDGEMIAVLHANPEAAAMALTRVQAQWRTSGEALDPQSIFNHLLRHGASRKITLERGDVASVRLAAKAPLEITYRKGYVAHASLETHAALADVRDGRATVWASTQTPFPTRDRVARRLGFEAKDVRVVTPFIGGGFGGKSADAQALEAARLAQLVGKPVQVARTRQEEFFYDAFDPAAVITIASGLDRDGRLDWWDASVIGSGERGATLLYGVPHARIQVAGGNAYGVDPGQATMHPFAVGPWRAPGANMNVFAFESQIDAMAAAAKADPLEFRLRHLSDVRMRRVLQTGACAFGWQSAATPSRRGVGLACSLDAGTCVATFAQVTVDRASGKVRVQRLVCAQDMGVVVNPEGARMQMEGALTMGLGYSLSEELRFRGGEILDRNFDTYRIPRFSDVPCIETVLVRNDELPPQGGGEPAITCTGAAIANAVFDLTAVRMDRLPLSAERVREMLAATHR